MKQKGFSLPEMLVALAISSILIVGATRMLPVLQRNNLRMLTDMALQEEMQLMMFTLEKAVRRAGYCKGECVGEGLRISGTTQPCLLVRWDENSNGIWEGVDSAESDLHGYRLRNGSLESQRGVDNCDSGGWEKLNDPDTYSVDELGLVRNDKQIRITLGAYPRAFPARRITLERWIWAENL